MTTYKFEGQRYEVTADMITKINRRLIGLTSEGIDKVTLPTHHHVHSLIGVLSHHYRTQLPLRNLHEMAAAYLNISRHEMYEIMVAANAQKVQLNKTMAPTIQIDELAMKREWQDAVARKGSQISIEEFKAAYINKKSDHLIDRPSDVPSNILSTTVGGVKKYYRSTPEELEKAIARSVRKGIAITLIDAENVEIGLSKFGGLPDLPGDALLPVDVDGCPMDFICQINLNQATTTPGWYVEEHGMLSVFKMAKAYQVFAGHDTLKVLYTPLDQEIVSRTDYKGTINSQVMGCSFTRNKTIPLPHASGLGQQLKERHNRNPVPIYNAAREQYYNQKASYLGFGYHDEPAYHQYGGQRIKCKYFMNGYIPLLYLPSIIDGKRIFESSTDGTFAVYIELNKYREKDYSQLSYMYHIS